MKKALSILLVLVMAVAMTACGGNSAVNVGNELLEGYDPSVQTTLNLANPSGDALTPDEMFDTFNAKGLNIELKVDTTPWNDFQRKLKSQLAAKSPATVFIVDSGYCASLGGKNAVMDLTAIVNRDLNKDDYLGSLYGATDAEGHLWGVPHAMNSIAIFYNKAIFDEKGIPYPTEDWTYEEMYDIAKKLTFDRDGDGEIDVYGFNYGMTNITEGWLPVVLASGAEPLDETRTKSTINTPEFLEGIKRFVAPVVEGFGPDNLWATNEGGSNLAFVNGKLAMFVGQSNKITAVNSNMPEGFDYDVQMMPIGWDGNRYCVYVPNQWSIYSGADVQQKGAAWEWVKHYLSAEGQQLVADTRLSGFPIHKGALASITDADTVPANIEAFYEGIDEYGVTLYENPCWTEWRMECDARTIELYANDGVGVEETVKEMHEFVQEALDYYYEG